MSAAIHGSGMPHQAVMTGDFSFRRSPSAVTDDIGIPPSGAWLFRAAGAPLPSRLHVVDRLVHELGHARLDLAFRDRNAAGLEIGFDLAGDVAVAGLLEIGEHHALCVGVGLGAGPAELLGRPQPEELVAARRRLEAQLLVVGELPLEGVLAVVEGRHRPLSAFGKARPGYNEAGEPRLLPRVRRSSAAVFALNPSPSTAISTGRASFPAPRCARQHDRLGSAPAGGRLVTTSRSAPAPAADSSLLPWSHGKGVLNNRISEYVFQHLNDIGVPTHFIRRLNMREQLIREVEIIPLEVVVRNVAAGSLAQRLGIEEGTQLPRSIIEFYYKNDKLNDPMVSEEHITAFGWAAPQEIDDIMALAIRVNDFLSGVFLGVGIRLVDFKMETGRLWEGDLMRIVVADEISPDSCRLWDIKSKDKLDKDRFRRDMGGLVEAYTEVARRLGILSENEKPAMGGPRLVQ